MAEKKKHTVTGQDLADQLRDDWYLLIADCEVYGPEDHLTLALVGRCLAEEVGGYSRDSHDEYTWSLPALEPAGLPAKTRRVFRLSNAARRSPISFLLAYKITGDPRYRAAWSAEYDAASAEAELLMFVQSLCGNAIG